MDVPLVMLPHRVRVSTYLGEGSEGPTYAAPVLLPANVQGALTVDGAGQRVGSLTVFFQAKQADKVSLQSLITWRGRDVTVRASAVRTDGEQGGWEHVEVSAA